MKPFRLEKVSSELQQIISTAIRTKLQDPRIAPLTTVTRVELSGDLEQARIYVSVFGSRTEQTRTMAALHHATGFIQSLTARQLTLRQCPHIVFHLDESLKKGQEVLELIDVAMQELKQDETPLEQPESLTDRHQE
ncbi:MAG: Ribosome-binding factor A [Phycisphaerae bacterium]|nr:Ribosome-binding factor A [Phycisphaerae bacterium]